MNRADGRNGDEPEENPGPLAYADEILQTIADRMAHVRLGVLPVVDRYDTTKFVGLVTQFDLLEARQKLLEEERKAERVLLVRRPDDQKIGDAVVQPPD